ncbi:Similar to Nfya: Nuclear transcription factor Y subunit alpha (Mus musculus) [Cotesia congregata]|uniref:Similar to Nfya: Nuclear transcription factor Y subunit alpha (Mus musculus) n=1 Tax=Cotesia congregata TaxID=51543 RepID=A0A8J2MYQ9_COTCN|nr:Similar to Nfya: Nuclear transcription factor Y subunit alpha (Mus musculus) [Cotesia congregata]
MDESSTYLVIRERLVELPEARVCSRKVACIFSEFIPCVLNSLLTKESRLAIGISLRRGIDPSCISLASYWQIPPFSATNTQGPRTRYRRPLVLNLPTNHWESAHENIQYSTKMDQLTEGQAVMVGGAGGTVQVVQMGQGGQAMMLPQQQPQTPQIIQTPDGQTYIYQPVQLDNQVQQAQQTVIINGNLMQIAGTSQAAAAAASPSPVQQISSPTSATQAGNIVMMVPGNGGQTQFQRVALPNAEFLEEEPLYVNAKHLNSMRSMPLATNANQHHDNMTSTIIIESAGGTALSDMISDSGIVTEGH